MKKYLITFTLLITVWATRAQEAGFTLQGKIKGITTGKIKLSYRINDEQFVQDSAAVQNGTFAFKGVLTEPVEAYISSDKAGRDFDDPNRGMFFLSPGNLTIELNAGHFSALKVTSSATQDESTALKKQKKDQIDQMNVLSAAYNNANLAYINAKKAGKTEEELEALKEIATQAKDRMDPVREEMDKVDMSFIKTHPDSYLTAYLLRWKVSGMPLNEGKAIYTRLSDRIKNSENGKEIAKEIKSLEGGSPGSVASVFAVNDINGQPISLADFKGKKYVLLDFWASWCVPCRKGNPHLIGLYNKYKDKGLEIIGVSDDDSNLAAWKKAVDQDKIGIWKHVLRGLKRTQTGYNKSADISEPYAIHTLPTKILIDKNGVIIGRYGGGGEGDEAMDKKLAEIFN